MMWKIYIYPFWQFRSVEAYLESMESCGFRVEKIYVRYLFKFKKVQSKSVRYVCSQSIIKDNEMHFYEYEIRKHYNAAKIPVIDLGGLSVHRICTPNVDLTSFVTMRNKYTKRLIINRIIFLIIYLIGSVCATINYSKCVHGLLIVTFYLFILLIYHVIGYIVVTKKAV